MKAQYLLVTCALVAAMTVTAAAAVRTWSVHPQMAQATASNPGYYTYHYDNHRTGWNRAETTLTTASVSSGHFGLIRTFAADSVVYAQPLYAPNVLVNGVRRNLVIIATENDSVYAYDADTGQLAWQKNFTNPAAGVTAVSPSSVNGCSQIMPTIGISSTPVIDPATGTLYVVDKFQVTGGSATTYHNQLIALDLRSGASVLPPTEIAGSARLSDGSSDVFADQWQQNRLGLLLSAGNVYVGFGSSCDENAAVTHGWMFAYNAHTLQNVAIFNTTTTDAGSYLGALWSATYAPAADLGGNLYLSTGNGAFDANTGGTNYGESVLRMTSNLKVAGYFSPSVEATLSNADQDVGSTGNMIVPNGQTPQLLVAGVKSGTMYLLNRANLGGFDPSSDRVFQEVQIGNGYNSLYGGPSYYPGFVYWGAGGAPMNAYALSMTPSPHLTLSSQTPNSFPGEGGEIAAVSSNGTQLGSAVIWATTRPVHGGTIQLFAYDATNLRRELYAGNVGAWAASGDAFLAPTVAHGHVFVGGAGYGVAEFGIH